MANQWGRDNGTQSGRTGSRASLFLAVFIAFALGLAGGYGVLRAFGPGNGSALETAQATAEQLKRDNARLESELAALRAKLAEAEAAVAVGPKTDDAALRETIARQAKELDGLTEQLAALSKQKLDAVSTVERQAEEILALKTERDAAKDSASEGDSALAAELARLRDEVVPQLSAERDALAKEVQDLNARIFQMRADNTALAFAKADDEKQIAALTAKLGAAERRLAAAQTALEDVKRQADATQPAPADTTVTPDEKTTPEAGTTGGDAALTPRDRQAVETAMRGAPGLEPLSDADRQRLKDMLVAGECVTTSLSAVFEHVPVLALRNLIRDLNSGC